MPQGPAIPRPTPKTPYRVIAKNSQVRADWDDMLKNRREPAIVCWEHIATAPREPIGSRYTRLKASLSTAEYDGQQLPQWQWELDRRARVRVGIGQDFVVIMDVSMGHPKENE